MVVGFDYFFRFFEYLWVCEGDLCEGVFFYCDGDVGFVESDEVSGGADEDEDVGCGYFSGAALGEGGEALVSEAGGDGFEHFVAFC